MSRRQKENETSEAAVTGFVAGAAVAGLAVGGYQLLKWLTSDSKEEPLSSSSQGHSEPSTSSWWDELLDQEKVQLQTVAAGSMEYEEISGLFLRSARGRRVLKVQRVKHPRLLETYNVHKKEMDKLNPRGSQNEHRLWHGTPKGTVNNIYTNGFNRSYCGRNATAFGNGVYFARDASYSAQPRYSPPDAAGHQYMFLARVLTGQYTKGKPGLVEPPVHTQGSGANYRYDSVVDNPSNPNIFVVFYDTQSYPEYLVTFM